MQQPGVIEGVERGGHRGSIAYTCHQRACLTLAGTSLASVLKGGWGAKRGPNYRSGSRDREYLLPPAQRALWKLERRIVNPKESSMKSSLGGKPDCCKPEQNELPPT